MKKKYKYPVKNLSDKGKVKSSSFTRIFIESSYSPYILPAMYFLIMFIVAMTNRPIGDYALETDFYWAYAPQAKEFLKGNLVIDQNRGPVYQIVLAVFGFLFGGEYFPAGKFLNVLFASITLFFILKIVSSIFNMRAAVMMILFVAVNTFFIKFTYEPGTDMLFLVFYTSAVYFLLKDKEINCKDFFIAGILSGIAYLTRYTAISLILSVGVILLIVIYKYFRSADKISFLKVLKPFIYYFTPVLALFTIWGFICLQKTGKFFYNMNYLNTAFTVYKPESLPADEWTLKYQDSFTSFYDVIFRDFGMFLNKILVINFSTFFVNDLSKLMPLYIGVLVAAGLVLFVIKFRANNLRQKYFFLFSLLFYVQILFAFYSERFSLPLLPFYCFLIVKISDYDFLKKINFNIGNIRLFTLIAMILLVINFSSSYKYVDEKINAVPVEILGITKWIKENYKVDLSEKTVMARKPQVAFYLDMKFEVIPFSNTYEELYESIKKKNVDYLYTSEWESRILNPAVSKVVLDYKNPPEGLELITYSPNPLTIFYKVKK